MKLLCVVSMILAAQAATRDITWDFSVSNAQLTVNEGDVLHFTFASGVHTVYNFGSLANFGTCTFTGGALLTESPAGQASFSSTVAGTTLYFGCNVGQHCAGGLKLTVTVQVAPSSSSSSALAMSSSSSAAPQAPDLVGCWSSSPACQLIETTTRVSVERLTVTVGTPATRYNFDFTERFSVSALQAEACGQLELHDVGYFTVGNPVQSVTDGFEITRVSSSFTVTPLTNSSVDVMDTVCKCGLTWTVGVAQVVPNSCITSSDCLLKEALTLYSTSSLGDGTWGFGNEETTPGGAQGNTVDLVVQGCGSSSPAAAVVANAITLLVLAVVVLAALL